MYLFKRCVVVNLVLLSIGNKCQDVQYEYTIDVPKYLCDKKDSLKTGVTTIRLQGKDAQKLQYEFAVNYKSISICKPSQRCTLTAWRAVRNLENHLRNACASQKSLEEINVDNALLIPGIQYVLNVLVKNNGTKVDNKQFILECTNSTTTTTTTVTTTTTTTTVTTTTTTTPAATTTSTIAADATINTTTIITNGSAMHSEQSSHTYLLLLGSNVTYRDMIYILNAEAVDCNINCSYYFKWEILDDSENLVLNDRTKGSELQISFEPLHTSNQYIIRCNLMSTHKNAMIAMALQNVNVIRRGMILKLAVSTLIVGLKRPFQLHAYLKDIDDIDGKTNIEWQCKYENRKSCSGFNTSQSVYHEKLHSISLECNGFVVVGRYNITVIVKKGNVTKQDSCEIRVEADGLTKIDVDNIGEPIDPSKDIEVPVYVSKLIASCMLQWMSVKRASYAYLDMQIVPGNINAITNITFAKDEILNEIDEYSNGTADLDYNLKIPAPKDDWKGLTGNSSYLFRLNVTCPVIQDEDDDDNDDNVEDAEPLLIQNYVTLYADIVLHTDPSPILNSLEVTPKQGVALKTIFKFMYQANGSTADNPVLYKFGYLLNNEIIFVSNLLGVTDTKSVLPYIDKGVKTVLEGCNSYSLCAQIFGPIVVTEMPLISEEDQNNLREQLHELMIREEYYKVFTYSLAILQTYNNTNDQNVSNSMQNYISNLTSVEIKRLLMQSADGDANWRVPANNLIKNVGILLNNFSASEILINNVVALRNELSRKNSLKLMAGSYTVNHRSRKLLMEQKLERFKREIEKITLEEVKSYLVISELIITTSPDKKRVRQERENLLNQIDKFMQGLCVTLYEKPQAMNLELKTMVLSVEKISKNTFNRYTHILYTGNTWNVNGRIKLGKCFTEKLKSNDQYCLGKAVLKNYMNKKGFVHMIKIYSAESDDQLFSEDLDCESVLVLPIDEKQVIEKEAKCALWKRRWVQSECKTLQVTKTIQCSCNKLGYYSLEYIVPSSTTTESTTTATTLEAVITTTAEATTTPVIVTDNEMLNDVETAIDIELSSFVPSGVETSSTLDFFASELIEATLPSVATESLTYAEKPTLEENVANTEVLSTTDEVSNNTLLATLYIAEDQDAIIYYFIIGFSISGIAMLTYGIRHLLSKDENMPNNSFPKYAIVHHQEMLKDLPNNTQ